MLSHAIKTPIAPHGGPHQEHIIVVGGGFGGLFAARALGRSGYRVTLIDKRNFHPLIGRKRAVGDPNWLKASGFPAWLLWIGVHIFADWRRAATTGHVAGCGGTLPATPVID